MVTYPPNPVIREKGYARFDHMDIGDLSIEGNTVAPGSLTVALVAGTDAKTDATISGMTTADTLVSVLSFVTASSIASVADRTSEYVVGTGKLVKAAGTDDRNNQLVVMYYHVA